LSKTAGAGFFVGLGFLGGATFDGWGVARLAGAGVVAGAVGEAVD
jgi:hypothetical protein